MRLLPAFLPARKEARDHAVPSADRVHQFALRRGQPHRLPSLWHEYRARAAERHQDIPRPACLKPPGVANRIRMRADPYPK